MTFVPTCGYFSNCSRARGEPLAIMGTFFWP